MTIPTISSYALPRPHDLEPGAPRFRPEPSRGVLLIHDMQDYFLRFFERTQEPLREVLTNLVQLRALCDARGVPVVYSAQPADIARARRGLLNDLWGPGLTQFPEQAGIVRELSPRPGDTVLEKTRYDAFRDTELLALMRREGRDQLWIGGVFAHIGCMLTAASAFMHDIEALLIADASADFSRPHHEQALSFVSGRCGSVLWSSTLAQALQIAPAHEALVRGELARLLELEPQALASDDDLRSLGLDSVRLMELADALQGRGYEVPSVDLMECETLGALVIAVGKRAVATSRTEARS